MIDRSLGLLVGDLRKWKKRRGKVQFKVHRPKGTGSCEWAGTPLLPDLLLAFNLWKAGQELVEGILPDAKLPDRWVKTTIRSDEVHEGWQVDWPQTFEIWASGSKEFMVRSMKREASLKQASFISDINGEFCCHCERVIKRLLGLSAGVLPDYLISIVNDLERFRTVATDYRERLPDFGATQNRFLVAVASEFDRIMSHPAESKLQEFRAYSEVVDLRPPRGTILNDTLRRIERWRERYLSCRLSLGCGTELEFDRGGAPEDLYEMWSFYELCGAALRAGIEDITQHCFLQKNAPGPHYEFGPFYAYFDFKMGDLREVSVEEVMAGEDLNGTGMPGVFVEWFIRHREHYSRSICLDAKFGHWDSREVLKVLGYMNNFGIDNGCVVMRADIRERTVGGEEIVPGLRKVRLPRGPGQVLWLLQLVPLMDYQETNEAVADAFVREAFDLGRRRGCC